MSVDDSPSPGVTDDEAERWRKLCDEATPGVWSIGDARDIGVGRDDEILITVRCDVGQPSEGVGALCDMLANKRDDNAPRALADAAFIAAARAALPALLDDRKAYQKANRDLAHAAMQAVEERVTAVNSMREAERSCAEMGILATRRSVQVQNLRAALKRVVESGAGTFRDIAREALGTDDEFKEKT